MEVNLDKLTAERENPLGAGTQVRLDNDINLTDNTDSLQVAAGGGGRNINEE